MVSNPPPPIGPASQSISSGISQILAQLAFEDEPSHTEYEGDPWHRVFYRSSMHGDDFFDALEHHDDHDEHGRLIVADGVQNSRHLALAFRGGDQQNGTPSGYATEPQNGNNHPTQSMRSNAPPPPPPPPSSSSSSYEHADYSKHCQAVPPPPPLQHNMYGYSARVDDSFMPLPTPPPPSELPLRFLRAGKGDPVEGQRRFEATLHWRQENSMNSILHTPHPQFELIKKHYPHYYHLRAKNGAPVFYELPPKTDLVALRKGGVDLPSLLRHYAMVTEFQWQYVERDDMARSITVIDLEGMRMRDFVGECVEYVKKCSSFTGQHYPERAGCVFVINVPGWFKMIWNVVKPMVDEVTLAKIRILRGKQEIYDELLEKIDVENIPPEYGGLSMPLGQSPQEQLLRDLVHHNNRLAKGDFSCGGRKANCRFCSFQYARSY